MYGNDVLGIRFGLGGGGAVLGANAALPVTGVFEIAIYVVAAFALLAAGLTILRLIPRRET